MEKVKMCFTRIFLVIMLALVGSAFSPASAQDGAVSGTVKDTQGLPLPGVNVIVKGTTTGTITDMDGNYSIASVASDAQLLFSFIGYNQHEEAIAGRSVVDVVLVEESVDLGDVVVVGYGVQKKSDLTGSISSVDNAALTGKGATTVMESLQGQVPGVDISQSSSRVGESFNISIRGKSTLGSSTNPLFVVDGIVVDDINFLNPSDIEKIDILKDASSTAIYGSRATNGVVIVTTKQATAGKSEDCMKVTVSYDGYVGLKRKARMPEFMDGREWMDYRFYKYLTPVKNAPITDGTLPVEMTDGNLLSVWCNKSGKPDSYVREAYEKGDFTDWSDIMLKKGTQQNHFVQVQGVGKQVSYRLGAGYQQEDGVMGDGLNRFNVKMAIDGKIGTRFTTGASLNVMRSDLDLGSKNAVIESFRANPYWRPYNTVTGELNYMPGKDLTINDNLNGVSASPNLPVGFSGSISPLCDEMNSKDETRSYRVLGTAYLQFKPIDAVVLKTTFSPTFATSKRGEYYGPYSSARSKNVGTSEAALTRNESFAYTWDTQANYVKTFGRHSVNALALFSVYSTESEKFTMKGDKITNETDWYNMGSAESYSNITTSYNKATMLSYAMRLNYGFADRYLLTASVRWDGSSKFTEGNQWGAFPSMAAAWRMSEESFIKDNADYISNLKLRLSYGVTGNNSSVGNYETMFLADKLYYSQFGKGFGPSTVNEDLSWEKTKEFNIGADFGFFNNRLSGSFDWYNRNSEDLLMERKLLVEQGSSAGAMTANVGKVKNSGVELMLKGILLQNSDFYWDVTFTYSKNKNEIVELQGKKEDIRSERWFIGEAIDVAYDLQRTGICTKEYANEVITVNGKTGTRSEIYGVFEGSMTYKDVNEDGKIDDADRVILGSAMPDWQGNISTSFSYKNWDLSAAVNIKQGQLVYSPFMEEFTDYSDRGRNKLKMDFYIPQGAPVMGADGQRSTAAKTIKGSYPFPFNDAKYNHGGGVGWHTGKTTEFKEKNYVDASYVKVKNITLGYTFGKDLMSKIGIQNLRIYANILNPFVFTDYKGFDPEWADAKINDGTGGPSSITYQFGLNVKF